MGKRSTGRKLAMQALYQAELQKKDVTDIIDDFLKSSEALEETKTWSRDLVLGVSKHKTDIDALIQDYAIDWSIDRILVIDKSVLRIAFYELCYTDIDSNIVLNEAIELAKQFSEDDSSKFINGILGKYVEKNQKQK